MEKKVEIAARMAVTNDGLFVTGTRVIGWSFTNSRNFGTPVPLINKRDLLFGKYPSFYNLGNIGIHCFMKPGSGTTDLSGTDFTLSAWVKTDIDYSIMRRLAGNNYYWSAIIQGDKSWCSNSTGLSFFLCGNSVSDNPYNNGFNTISNSNQKFVFDKCVSKKNPWLVNTPIIEFRLDQYTFYRMITNRTDNPFIIDEDAPMDRYHHIAVCRKADSIYYFVDGILQNKAESIHNLTNANFGTDDLGIMQCFDNNSDTVYQASRCSYNDICYILGKALWTKDFIPPNDFILGEHMAVEGMDKTVWGFEKISPIMPNNIKEKVNLYEKIEQFKEPRISDYKNVNNVFKINKYKENV